MKTIRNRPESARPATKPAKTGRAIGEGVKRGKRATLKPRPLTWADAELVGAYPRAMSYTIPVLESANVMWRNQRGRTHKSARSVNDVENARYMFRKAHKMRGPLSVRIVWHRARAVGDVDNRIKPTLDLLRGIAYDDDASIVEVSAVRIDDPTHPACLIVTVTPYLSPNPQQEIAA